MRVELGADPERLVEALRVVDRILAASGLDSARVSLGGRTCLLTRAEAGRGGPRALAIPAARAGRL